MLNLKQTAHIHAFSARNSKDSYRYSKHPKSGLFLGPNCEGSRVSSGRAGGGHFPMQLLLCLQHSV